jgi:hypothetical protein
LTSVFAGFLKVFLEFSIARWRGMVCRCKGYHATGAKLLNVIEEAQGSDAVLRVMEDPRSLLVVYNQCAEERKERFRFDPELAGRIETMGGIGSSRIVDKIKYID